MSPASTALRWSPLALAVLALAACDANGPEEYAVEVSPAEAVQTEAGEAALRFEVRNVGTEPLESVYLDVQTPPRRDASVGTRLDGLGPGETRVADVVLLHLSASETYACYRAEVAAFAAGRREAVLSEDGPTTCR